MTIICWAGSGSGFTLIEVMVAILIFSLGVLSTASMQTASLFANSKSVKFTEASQLAANQAEDINMASYETLVEGETEVVSSGNNGETYTIKKDVGPELSYTDSNGVNTFFAREITVTVGWDDKSTDLSFIKTPAF